ncbi:Predicted ATPase of the ABC class [Desulfuromusa kysingii]|uniref:Predicted ATPase of the ABC class n=1 Tax=Desulfuromusa kysingii TaxID=37625 RepID=A0A1H3VZY5_9BACT|nr:ABC-ATPase domain-containing protein [Desulfuromusa kysingii]SDZ79764.1 Predicted ATPase of the ABC class [Desulfuromusa kysingii]
MEKLRTLLHGMKNKGYKTYKQLQGTYNFHRFQLSIDHVQGDPFALPSRISVQLSGDQHGIPPLFWEKRIQQTALEDFLGRAIHTAIKKHVKGGRGTGRSGEMEISINGQQVLQRNAVLLDDQQLEARLLFALPGSGRSILADEAATMFFTELPQIIDESLISTQNSLLKMKQHIDQIEDQDNLRGQLKQLNGVAFIADGSILPRHSGIDDHPLIDGVPFKAPEELKINVKLPHRGLISGMLIPTGVTLIVGGGFHGKSTVLHALERGIYNHIPGDGRELVTTTASAVKIRAEDHRTINHVNISPFIATLPGKRTTESFSTDNASGSTSQAANIIEALECNCTCLLIDEDTSATNFMIRDQRMRKLVPDNQEPITPLLYRIRELYENKGISSIIVTGGSGDYLAVADRVIMLDNYQPFDVSEKAKSIAGRKPMPATPRMPFKTGQQRQVDLTIHPLPRQREAKIQVREQRLLEYGQKRIDLSQVEQLLDSGQTEAIGRILLWCHRHHPEQKLGVLDTLQQAVEQVEQQGLDILLPWKAGHLALPRLYEVVAAANRLRPGAEKGV